MDCCNVEHTASEYLKIFIGKPERADRILLVCIEARAKQNQFRPVFRGEKFETSSELVQIRGPTRSQWERNIACGSATPAASRFLSATGSRIKRPAMDRKKSNLRVFPEDVLRSVSVMDIPVDNQNSFHIRSGTSMCSSNRHMIEKTKSHRTIPNRMVSRWTDQTESGSSVSLHNP